MPVIIPRQKTGVALLPKIHVALFNLGADEIQAEGLGDELRAMGLAAKIGVGHRPSPVRSPAASIADWEATVGKRVDRLKDLGIPLICDGDDFCREADDRAALDEVSYAGKIVGHIAERCAHAIYLNACDESTTKLGWWIPERLVIPWQSAGGPPIAFPGLGQRSPHETTWAGYVYRQWSWWSQYTLRDRLRAIELCMADLPTGKIAACMISAITETKFTDPNGNLFGGYPCIEPHEIEAQLWAAIGWGASIVELFSFDCQRWIEERRAQKPNSFLMTGIRQATPYWRAFKDAIDTLRAREHWTYGPHFKPVKDRHFIWFRVGRLVYAINRSAVDRKAPDGRGVVSPGGVWFKVVG